MVACLGGSRFRLSTQSLLAPPPLLVGNQAVLQFFSSASTLCLTFSFPHRLYHYSRSRGLSSQAGSEPCFLSSASRGIHAGVSTSSTGSLREEETRLPISCFNMASARFDDREKPPASWSEPMSFLSLGNWAVSSFEALQIGALQRPVSFGAEGRASIRVGAQ